MKKSIMVFSVLVGFVLLPLARADVMPNLTLPPMDGNGFALGSYTSPEQYHALYDSVFRFNTAIHYNWASSFAPPAYGFTDTHSFNSDVHLIGGAYSPNGGGTWIPVGDIYAPALTTVRITGVGPLDYSTEMLGLNITASTPLGTVLIRESPTLASTGHTTLTAVSGGYTVDSFFDVFTEISLDGGNSWIPDSLGPVHVLYECPEPGTTSIGLLGLGLAGLLRMHRRSRKS